MFYDGENITDNVSGDLRNESEVKEVVLYPVPGAMLVVSGHVENGTDGCDTGGFYVACDGNLTDASVLEAYGSPYPVDPLRRSGAGGSWSPPCAAQWNATTPAELPGTPQSTWAWAPAARYAAFRSEIFRTVTCEFSSNYAVDSVFYDGQNISHLVSGNFTEPASAKRFSFDLITGAHLSISAHVEYNGSDMCDNAAFKILCSNSLVADDSRWETFSSDAPVDDEHAAGSGYGWGGALQRLIRQPRRVLARGRRAARDLVLRRRDARGVPLGPQ